MPKLNPGTLFMSAALGALLALPALDAAHAQGKTRSARSR